MTTHLNLKDVSKNVQSGKIITKIKTIQTCYKKYFKKPKIGVRFDLTIQNLENSEEL